MRTRAVLPLVLAVAALPASAVELELGLTGRAGWESNLFRSSNHEESAFSGAVGPDVRVRERTRALDVGLWYRMFYEEFAQESGLGNFEHYLSSDGTWRATPRDTFSFDQSYIRTDSLTQLTEIGVTGLASNQLVSQRDTVERNAVHGGYTRMLSPLWQLTVGADNINYWYEDPTDSDSRSTSGSADVTHLITPRHRVGAGVAYTRQDFEDTEFTNGSGTSFAQLYALWAWEVSQTVSFASSIGPRLAIPDDLEDTAPSPSVPLLGVGSGFGLAVDPSTCPAFRPGVVRFDSRSCSPVGGPIVLVRGSSVRVRDFDFLVPREQPDENLGFFGRLSLSKRWEHVTTTLSYERSASAASGLAASTDLDVVSLRTDWRPRRQWRVTGIASWEHQVSSSEIPLNQLLLSATPVTLYVDAQGNLVDAPVPGGQAIPGAAQTVGLRTQELVDNAVDIQSTRLELRVGHDFTQRLSMNAFVVWWRQESKGDFQSDDVITDALVQLSLTWRFAPIEL